MHPTPVLYLKLGIWCELGTGQHLVGLMLGLHVAWLDLALGWT